MNNKNKYFFLLGIMIIMVAGFIYIKNSHRNVSANFRDAVADNSEFDTKIPENIKGASNNLNIPTPVDQKEMDVASLIPHEIVADRSRVERTIVEIKKDYGNIDFYTKRQILRKYENARETMNDWIEYTTLCLDNNNCDGKKFVKLFREVADNSFEFSKYVATSVLGYWGPGRYMQRNVSQVALEDWLEGLKKQYSNSSEEKKKIRNEFSSFSWKNFNDIKDAPPVGDDDDAGNLQPHK